MKTTTILLIGGAVLIVLYFLLKNTSTNAATIASTPGPGGATGVSSGNTGAVSSTSSQNADLTAILNNYLSTPGPTSPLAGAAGQNTVVTPVTYTTDASGNITQSSVF